MIPFSTVIEDIRQLADESPDRRAECRYFNEDGKPCCIVGHVFAAHGGRSVTLSTGSYVKAAEGDYVVAEGDAVFAANWPALGVEAPNSAEATWIENVQLEQDERAPWGLAVQRADAVA